MEKDAGVGRNVKVQSFNCNTKFKASPRRELACQYAVIKAFSIVLGIQFTLLRPPRRPFHSPTIIIIVIMNFGNQCSMDAQAEIGWSMPRTAVPFNCASYAHARRGAITLGGRDREIRGIWAQ